jgi:hypothetical protein
MKQIRNAMFTAKADHMCDLCESKYISAREPPATMQQNQQCGRLHTMSDHGNTCQKSKRERPECPKEQLTSMQCCRKMSAFRPKGKVLQTSGRYID